MKMKLKFIMVLFLMIFFTNIFIPFTSLAMEDWDAHQFDDSSYNTLVDMPIGNRHGTLGEFITNGLSVILTIIRIIAVGWAILMAISIATKYITHGPHMMAQLKTDLPTYLIGVAILFGAAGILTLIQYFVDDNI